MRVGIVDYGAGNVQSVMFALQRLGCSPQLYAYADDLDKCDKLIFPGVGHAKFAMEKIRQQQLDTYLLKCKKPVLGICLGMQLMCAHSDEGNVSCIGIFDAPVKKFEHETSKIPHMGWNVLTNVNGTLLDKTFEQGYMYYVHSYYVPVNAFTTAQTNYILPFSACLEKDNFFAAQFHPEKSGKAGEELLRKFLAI